MKTLVNRTNRPTKKASQVKEKKVLMILVRYETGIFQSTLTEIAHISSAETSAIVNRLVQRKLIMKERTGNTYRLTPDINAIRQVLQNKSNSKPEDGHPKDRHENFPDKEQSESPRGVCLKAQVIKVFPEKVWQKDYVPPKSNSGVMSEKDDADPDNWTPDVYKLFKTLCEQEIDNGIFLLRQSMESEKSRGLKASELLHYCNVQRKDIHLFLKIIAVLINDENSKKIRKGEKEKIIKEIIIENHGAESLIKVKTKADDQEIF